MLQNAYLLAKIGADTAENEQHFAENLPTDALWDHREPRAGRARRADQAARPAPARPGGQPGARGGAKLRHGAARAYVF